MRANRFTIVNIGCLSMNKYWGETQRLREPSATCTLLESGTLRLLVDPSPAPERLEPLLFATTGLRPAAIDAVFVTHCHGDHRFGLELFAGKPWFMAARELSEWRASAPADAALIARFLPAEEHLPEGVRLLPTPGHTRGHHSLMLTTAGGCVIAAGDAVMTRDFFDADDGFHNSVDFAQVARTIQEIRQAADVVIPGHGNYFVNDKRGGKT
jgi:glyoxylase-like metal-dependent hydrolase (beta-lactamase superfamily II)